MNSSSRQFRTRQPIQTNPLLCRHHRQVAVKLRRYADPELTAVMLFCHGFGHRLSAGLHVGHYAGHDFANAF